MAKNKQNLNWKIQMLAGKGIKEFFERFYKNLTSLVLHTRSNFTPILNILLFNPIDNAKTKVQHIFLGNHETERAKDMIDCDQDGRLMVHTTKQYPTEDATCFHVLGRVMSGKNRALNK